MEKKSICLKEEQLREFVSYSVKRLLKEALSRPIDGSHGTFGGWEIGKYGHDSMEINFDPTDNDKMAQALEDMLEDGEFNGLTPEMFMEGGQFSTIWPINVRIDYEIKQGGKGNGYDTPDDPDEAVVKDWYADTSKLGEVKPFVDALIKSYIEDGYFDEEEIWENEHNSLYEDKASSIHFNGNSSFQSKNPYENMTWDEYCEAKRREREEDEKKTALHDTNYPEEKENRAIKVHFGGKKHEETPEDKMNLTKEDLAEMVNKSVRFIAERINLNEISKGLLDRAREAAHKDMMRNFGDSKIRQKRERQWKKFGDEYRRMNGEEKDSICPQVDEMDLVNMPEDTYVIMNGDGRDAVNANFRSSYSGRAGTKEQCEEYVKKFYDSGANWEYLPEILPLKDFLRNKRS